MRKVTRHQQESGECFCFKCEKIKKYILLGLSNSAIDPSEGLDIFKATYGKYVVKPQDGDFNKAEGPSQSEMERIRADLCDIDPAKRAQFASTGSNSLGNGPR